MMARLLLVSGLLITLSVHTAIPRSLIEFRKDSLSRSYHYLLSEFITFNDFLSNVVGWKRARADQLWIQTKIYLGTDEFQENNYSLTFSKLKRCLGTVPQFGWGYYYGSAVLAWFLHRPREAFQVIKMGLEELHPHDRIRYYLKLHLGVLLFEMKENREEIEELIALYEKELAEPDHPVILDIILGHFYMELGRLEEARRIFRRILTLPRTTSREIEHALDVLRKLEKKPE